MRICRVAFRVMRHFFMMQGSRILCSFLGLPIKAERSYVLCGFPSSWWGGEYEAQFIKVSKHLDVCEKQPGHICHPYNKCTNLMGGFDFARFVPAAYFFFSFLFGSRKNSREPCDCSRKRFSCYILIIKAALFRRRPR